ncbi:UNVERIFIED_ORG: septal ring factor EnvC (AmiA/AmiB activator) [Bacillus sp. PvP124]|nr:septal ring factor EnvC (AmiA/AmiB activator) [Bacillus sp. PvP124]
MYSDENIKIGSRILNSEQATVLLPNYPKINNQINRFREEAKKFNKKLENTTTDDYQKYEMYSNFDNVMSILGERGSGKTSVFLTLKQVHNSEEDITLPLIVPDNMGETSDTLGWIISYLEEYVDRLHPRLKSNERRDIAYNGLNRCIDNEDSELQKKFKKLRKTYEIRKEVYLNKILKRDEGTKEYINDKAKMTQADQSLIVDFNAFVNALIKAQKEVNVNKEIEPLILIFFDDVDISAHRCPEVLETIRNYLNHPNIVAFVSGDFKVFSEIVCLEFLRKEGVKSKDYNEVFISSQQLQNQKIKFFSALELRKERSQEYLKKVLPPSFRFYMKKLTDRDKSNFSYEFSQVNKANGPSLSNLLARIENKGNKFSWNIKESENNFLLNNEKIPYAFFEIFDDNPRGLINPYYYLYQKVHLNENQIWDISDINRFLQIILNSSVKLQKYKANIEDIIVINEMNHVTNDMKSLVYINYDLLLEMFINECINSKEESLVIEEFTTLYILCLFFEKLIEIVIPNYLNYSSGNLLSRILNRKTESLFPNIEDDDLLLRMYSAFDNKLPLNTNKIFNEDNKGTKALEQIYFETLNKSMVANTHNSNVRSYDLESLNLIHLFQLLFQKDEHWVSDKVLFIKNNGKSYKDIYYNVIYSVDNKLSFLNQYQRFHLLSGNFVSERELISALDKQFEDLKVTYGDFSSISQDSIRHLVKVGSNLEKLLLERDSLDNQLNIINEELSSVINRVKVTQEELENIEGQERLIETRKKMLSKIKDLETFTQDKLRKEEWQLFKMSFTIGRNISSEKWVDENGMEISKEPLIVFDPQKSSLEFEELIGDSLDAFTRVGLFVKDKHTLPRQDSMNFIKRYFIEEQESILLKAHLPLDIEGRKKQIVDLNNRVKFLDKQIRRTQSNKDEVESQLKVINQYNYFRGEEPSEVSYILQQRYKDYLLSSIYQQIEAVVGKKDVKKVLRSETNALLEILKIYEEGIEEAKSFLIKDDDFESTEEVSNEEYLVLKLNAEENTFLRALSRRAKDIGEAFERYNLSLRKYNEIRIENVIEIIRELKQFHDTRNFGRNYRDKLYRLIDSLEDQVNVSSSKRVEESKTHTITIPALSEITIPYIYIKILVENRRINEENATAYFRKLKKELTDFIDNEKSNKKQTRFVRFLEKMLSLK